MINIYYAEMNMKYVNYKLSNNKKYNYKKKITVWDFYL